MPSPGRRPARSSARSLWASGLVLVCASTALVVAVAAPANASAPTPPVSLGSAANFAILAGSTITNTGATTVDGNLGLSPGTSVTGFPPGQLTGTSDVANAAAAQGKVDLATAYDDAAASPTTATVPVELGGTTQTPGVYDSPAGTFGITGTLTLDAQGDPGAIFIFKAASTLITASASNVRLINGAQADNVFWQVGSSATLGTNSTLWGNVLALTSITVTTGVTVDGRVLARNGAVSLDTDAIARTVPVSGDSTLSVTVSSAAGLTISVPATADLGTALPGSNASGDLGPVTVSDERGLSGASWTATVSATDLTTGGNTPAETIPAIDVSYWSGPATATTGSGTFTPGQPTAADAELINVPRTAFSLSAGSDNNTATWNPTLSIDIPRDAVAGVYTGTVTHSVL